ncbi:putative tetratricopeptide-like helical domain superfamily [Helianthus debilis subsp. tardiflorus]
MMVRRGLHPDVITYSALIDGYCLRGEIDEAEKVLDGMVEKELVPNIITYNSLINGYCKKKRIGKAMRLFEEIQDKGLIPDVVTYNSMLQGLFESGNPAAARELFNEMQAKGHTPTVLTYGILFHGMCKNSQTTDALALFRSLVIRVYCEEGLLVKGKELLRKMEVNGCLPNSFTYNLIVRELLKKNEPGEAEILLEEMINRGFMPDHATFENLLVRIPNVGKDSRLRTIVLKLTSVERKDGKISNITSPC